MKKIIIIVGILVLLIGCNGNLEVETVETDKDGGNSMYININNNRYEVFLENNETVLELLKILPLNNIIMNELNGNEKYYCLDEVLPTRKENIEEINIGDIMLYNNNCIVIFYDNFKPSYSYTKIGRIKDVSKLKEVLGNNNVEVSITK